MKYLAVVVFWLGASGILGGQEKGTLKPWERQLPGKEQNQRLSQIAKRFSEAQTAMDVEAMASALQAKREALKEYFSEEYPALAETEALILGCDSILRLPTADRERFKAAATAIPALKSRPAAADIATLTECHKEYQILLGERNAFVLRLRQQLGRSLALRREYESALSHLEPIETPMREVFGRESDTVLQYLDVYASVLVELEKYDQADALFRECWDCYVKYDRTSTGEAAMVQCDWAHVYRAKKDYATALRMAQRAAAIGQLVGASEGVDECIVFVIECYLADGKPLEAMSGAEAFLSRKQPPEKSLLHDRRMRRALTVYGDALVQLGWRSRAQAPLRQAKEIQSRLQQREASQDATARESSR